MSFVFWLQNVFKFLSVFFFFFFLHWLLKVWCTLPGPGSHCSLQSWLHGAQVDALITRWGKIDHSLQLIPFITSCQRLRQASHRQHGASSSQRLLRWVKTRLTDTNLHQHRGFRVCFFLSLWMLFISQTKIYISYQVSVRRNETDLSWNVSHYQLVDVSSGSLHINPSFGKTWWSYLDANMSLWTPTYPKRHDKHNHPQHEQMNLNVLLMDGWWVSFPKSGLKKKTCGAKKLNMSIK